MPIPAADGTTAVGVIPGQGYAYPPPQARPSAATFLGAAAVRSPRQPSKIVENLQGADFRRPSRSEAGAGGQYSGQGPECGQR